MDAWPIGIGAPCIGCTEKKLAFRVPMFQVIPIHDATPPESYAPIESPQGSLSVPDALVVGGVAGALPAVAVHAALAAWRSGDPARMEAIPLVA